MQAGTHRKNSSITGGPGALEYEIRGRAYDHYERRGRVDGIAASVFSGPSLTGVFPLARVAVELLLEVGLGIDGSTEGAHRDFEFPAAEVADRNGRGRAKPLDDSKIALFRRFVLLRHRTESLTFPEVHSI